MGNDYGLWTTTSASTMTLNVAPATYVAYQPAPARTRTPFEWLDAEVESTCALARAA
jgi:hypothetical protein